MSRLNKRISLNVAIALGLFLIGFNDHLRAQNVKDPIKEVVDASRDYVRQRPREKVYLHFEQSEYKGNERIWFTAYTRAGSKHRVSQISSKVKLQLLSEALEPVYTKEVVLVNGLGNGFIDVDRELKPGKYFLTASTDWIENFGKEQYFKQAIWLNGGNESMKDDSLARCDPQLLTVLIPNDFLIAGIDQKIGIQTGILDQPQVINLLSTENEKVGSVSLEKGWAELSFRPKEDTQYYLQLAGCTTQTPLPEVRKNGLIMSVRSIGQNSKMVNLQSNDPAHNAYTFTGVVFNNGTVSTGAKIKMNNGRARALIPTVELSPGIGQIVLFDSLANPIAQQLVFRPLTDEYSISSSSERNGRNLELKLALKDAQGEPIDGRFSLSIRTSADSSFLPADEFTYLNSEIKGEVVSALSKTKTDQWLSTRRWNGPLWQLSKEEFIPPVEQPLQTYVLQTSIENDSYIDEFDPEVRVVKGVEVTAEKRAEDEDELKLVTGKGDVTIDFDDNSINDSQSVLDVLQGSVAGVLVRGSGMQATWDPPSISIRGVTGTRLESRNPLIIMDQSIELTIEELDQMRASEIGSIEIFKGPAGTARWGARGAMGVIALYSRKDVKKRTTPSSQKKRIKTEAFELGKTEEVQKELIHWAPALAPDKAGEIAISIKLPAEYTEKLFLRIEGFTQSGIPVSSLLEIKPEP